jgi:tripeptide aminopeptidase
MFSCKSLKYSIQRKEIDPGYVRVVLIHPLIMAAKFIQMLPQNEAPETTDGKQGYY